MEKKWLNAGLLSQEHLGDASRDNARSPALSKLNGWGFQPGDIAAWSSVLSNEARRLELRQLDGDSESITLLRELASQVLQVKGHMEKQEEEVRSLRNKLADQKRNREALEVLKHHVELLEERCQKQDEETAGLREKLREQASLFKHAKNVEANLRERVMAKEASASAAHHVLQQQMEEMGGQLAAFQEDAEKREELRERVEKELRAAVEKNTRSTNRIEQLSATVQSLEAQQSKSTAEIKTQGQQLEARASEVSELKLELARTRERLRGAQEDLENQRSRFEEKEAEWEGVIRQADERLNEADLTILDLRRTVASLENELARTCTESELTKHHVGERERSAEEQARAQATTISHLQEELRRNECELAELHDEHSRRAAPEVERIFVEEIERLQRQTEVARTDAQQAIEDATEAAAARDAAERRLLQVVARVADEASDLRHLLAQEGSSPATNRRQSLEQGLSDEVEAASLPEPAGMALSTLSVTARKVVTALRETREREAGLEKKVAEGSRKLEQLERECAVRAAATVELKRLLERTQEALHVQNADGESERKEAQEQHETLLQRCTQLERQQRALVDAVANACSELQRLTVPEDLRANDFLAEEETARQPVSLTGLQVSLAEQTESVSATHATLVRLCRQFKSDAQELSAWRSDGEKALHRAREHESKLRLQLQAKEEALLAAKKKFEQAEECSRREIKELEGIWRGRLESEVERSAQDREQNREELETSRAAALRLLNAVQLLIRYAAPVRQKLSDVRRSKAFLSAQLRASVFQVHSMQTAVASIQESLLGDPRVKHLRPQQSFSESAWEEKAIMYKGLQTFEKESFNPLRKFRAAVQAVTGHLRLLALGRLSVNQTVTKVCQESVPLLPRGSVRMDDKIMVAVAEAADRLSSGSIRDEAEAVVRLLDTVQRRSPLSGAPMSAVRLVPARSKATVEKVWTLVDEITGRVEAERKEHNDLLRALQDADSGAAKGQKSAQLWEDEARRYGDVIAHLEARERALQAELRRSVPLDEHRTVVEELRRIKREAQGVLQERAEVDRELASQVKVASKLRTQLSDAREVVHGKILATDRLGLELQKEREELRRLRDSSALQEAHHKRLQDEYKSLIETLRKAEIAASAAKEDVDERADVARRKERRAVLARESFSSDKASQNRAIEAAEKDAEAAKQEALLSQQRLRKQSAVFEELTGQSEEMQRELQASREHAMMLRKELQSAIEREVAERDDRTQWARARAELQAVRSAAEERLARLIDTSAEPESLLDVNTVRNKTLFASQESKPTKADETADWIRKDEVVKPARERIESTDGSDRNVGVSARLLLESKLAEKGRSSTRSASNAAEEKVAHNHARRVTDVTVSKMHEDTEGEGRSKRSMRSTLERKSVRSEVAKRIDLHEDLQEPTDEEDAKSMKGRRRKRDQGSDLTVDEKLAERGMSDEPGNLRVSRNWGAVRQSDIERRRRESAATEPVTSSRKPPSSMTKVMFERARSVSEGQNKANNRTGDGISPSVKDMISELRRLATLRPPI